MSKKIIFDESPFKTPFWIYKKLYKNLLINECVRKILGKSLSPVFFVRCRRSYMLNDSLKCKDVPYISMQFIFWVYFESYSQNIKYFCSNSRVSK